MFQGLNWYTDKLKQDRDGDVADEFLLERSSQSSKPKQNVLQVRFGFMTASGFALLHFANRASVQTQKRHLKSPKDPTVLVEGGNVYVVPN